MDNQIVQSLTRLGIVDDFNQPRVKVSGVARHFIAFAEETCRRLRESIGARITAILPSRPLIIEIDVPVESVCIDTDGEAPDSVWAQSADAFWIR